MTGKRASIFDGELATLAVDEFSPKTSIDKTAPAPERIKGVAEAAQFRSREPATTKPQTSSKRQPRRYRTGRNVQFNVKAQKETVDAFYAVTEGQGWVLGYTLERAIQALQRELEKKK